VHRRLEGNCAIKAASVTGKPTLTAFVLKLESQTMAAADARPDGNVE